jgi:RNA:NAD 2'-phosphotransferase (TPT1/KptA family)
VRRASASIHHPARPVGPRFGPSIRPRRTSDSSSRFLSWPLRRTTTANGEGLRAGSEAFDVVLETIHRNAASLVGLARRHSLCADDANDAYQHGIEIPAQALVA